jgi:hypothetical protein
MRRFQQNLIHIFLTFGLFFMNFESWMNGQVYKLTNNSLFFSSLDIVKHSARRWVAAPRASREKRRGSLTSRRDSGVAARVGMAPARRKKGTVEQSCSDLTEW